MVIFTLLSGYWIMPSIAVFIVKLTVNPQETTGSEAPDIENTLTTNCTFRQLEPLDVIQDKGKLLIKNRNLTISKNQHYVFDPILNLCFTRSEMLNKDIFDKCLKWEYNEDGFSVLQNGSVKLFEVILEPGSYAIKDGILQTCVNDCDDLDDCGNRTRRTEIEKTISSQVPELVMWTIYIEQAGSSISIIALTVHLVCFCLVPTMRHLHGYNLASLSGAFLFGYLFSLIGKMPQVLGTFCGICGILEQFFFLAAFFCMNTLVFDVWRTLSLAANKLAFFSPNTKRRHFIYYSIYSWGTPLLITATSVSMDNTEGTPMSMRPGFGKHSICYMTNINSTIMFYAAPTFVLSVMNGIFFVMCVFLVKKHTMKCAREELSERTRSKFVLHFSLGMIMAIFAMSLFGFVAIVTDNAIVFMVFDLMNSLQGFFVLLPLACSENNGLKTVFAYVREKLNYDADLRTTKTSASNITPKRVVTQET